MNENKNISWTKVFNFVLKHSLLIVFLRKGRV